MNRTAADIARAYARFASQATGELLLLGAEAAGASAACLYWRVREQVIVVPEGSARTPAQQKLRQQIRRDIWPWVQRLAPPAADRVLVVPHSAAMPGVPNGESMVLLTLQDHAGEPGGIIALCVSAERCADILGPWRDEAIGFAELVRENLLADLDRDTGLLTPASFDAELQKWKDSAHERCARACLLTLHLDHLESIEQSLGAEVRRKALQQILGLIETRLRGRDLVARIGPACIAVMLKQCDLIDAERVSAALDDRLRDYQFRSGITRFPGQVRISMQVLDPRRSEDAEASTPAERESTVANDVPTSNPVDRLDDLLLMTRPVHTASVLRFPDRPPAGLPLAGENRMVEATQPLPGTMNQEAESHSTSHFTSSISQGLRAQPCRLLTSTDRVLIYRLRRLVSGSLHGPVAGLATPLDQKADQQAGLVDVLDQMGRATASLLLTLDAVLIDDHLLPWLIDACRIRHITPSRLCLAVSEAVVVAEVRRVLPVLGRLHRAGFQLCVETGGDGIHSPALLRRLPIDYLYASMSPGRLRTPDPVQVRLLSEQVALADTQGARVICGGVDTADQTRELAALGVLVGHGRALGASIPLSRLRAGN